MLKKDDDAEDDDEDEPQGEAGAAMERVDMAEGAAGGGEEGERKTVVAVYKSRHPGTDDSVK